MSRRLVAVDRLAGVVLGLLLLSTGLLALDWRLGRVLDLPTGIDTTALVDVVTSSWWPWAFAGGAVLLGLLGLRWLLAHLLRSGARSTRLAASNETGRLTVDLGSLASVAAERLEASAPVSGVRGRAHTVRGHTLVELSGQVDADADADDLVTAAGACIEEVAAAFEAETPVTCRVLIQAPRAKRAGRTDRVRVS